MAVDGTGGEVLAGSATTRYLRFLLIGIVVVPLTLFAGASWVNYSIAGRDAHERVARATDAIDQQAQKVFEADELILDQIAERVADMDWPEIAHSEELHRLLQRLAARPEIAAIGLSAPDRTVVATSSTFPMPPVTAAQRSYLPVERASGEPLYVGSVAIGRYSHHPHFMLARDKPNASHTPGGGLIFVAMDPSSFIGFYRSIVDPGDYLVDMVRADGALLVRYPGEELVGRVLNPESAFRRTIAESPERGAYDTTSTLDGTKRLFAYRRVANYPVYVAVGLSRQAVISGWMRLMAGRLILGTVAMLGLVALTLLALRRSATADGAVAMALVEGERRKAAEESLHHAQRMEAVGQMTGGVAHDFNNLLTAVTGNLDMILRRPEDAARVKRLAEAALRATTHGERLTEHLLMFSRRQMMRPETLNLNRVLIEFEGLMQRAVGQQFPFRLQLDPGVDPSRIDRAQFEAAVLNLVVNARDALGNDGRITVETRNVVLDEDYVRDNPEVAPGPYVLVSVTDNGSGIDKADLPRVFEPFFTTKGVGKGSGLGLSQVYGFAKESGGHIKVYSELGIGTTVKLYLPKSTERPVEAAPRGLVPLRSAVAGETVLVVEDDEAVLAMAVESLEDLGYRVLMARNGQDALDIVKGPDKIDILFSDIVMPGGITGAQLAAMVRRLKPSIRVLLTSGYSASALAGEHGLPEDIPVLGKPYRRDELAAHLRVIVGGQGR